MSKLLDMLLFPVLFVWFTLRVWDHRVAEPYREEGRNELRPQLAEANRQVLAAADIINRQNASVLRYEQAVSRRVALAEKAARDKDNVISALQAKAREVATLPQPIPDDPCASACTLLQRPL